MNEGSGKVSSKKKLIWLDCDPGHDDFFAILLAGHSDAVDLIGISTVAGNQTLDKTTMNALNCLYAGGISTKTTPVTQGLAFPLLEANLICPEIHGESGLERVSLDGVKSTYEFPCHGLAPIEGKAVNNMARIIMAQPQKVHLVATGRLTNIAVLLTVYPEVTDYLEEIVLMGGALRGGNTHPLAEFNIQGDAEAAKIVFERGTNAVLQGRHQDKTWQKEKRKDSAVEFKGNDEATSRRDTEGGRAPAATRTGSGSGSVPIVMVPLEVTHTAIVTDAVTARIRQLQQGRTLTPTAGKENNAAAGTDRSSRLMSFPVLLEELLFFFHSTYRDVFHFHTGPPLHDPCAIFYVLAPDAFTTTHWRVDVDTTSPLCKGTTVVDIWRQSALKPNVVVCQEMDVDRFWDAMLKALQRATDVSPLGGGL